LATVGHIGRVHSEAWVVDALNISGCGGGWTEVIVVVGHQGKVGGEDWGVFEGGSGTLERTGVLVVEGGGDNSVDPRGLGVELLRQLGMEEDGGLPAQGRHLAEEEKSWG